MNGYVFVRDAGDEVLAALKGLASREPETGVRHVASIAGPYDALVALSASSLGQLEQRVRTHVRGAGATSTETAIELPPPRPFPIPSAPRWGMMTPVEAYVQIRVLPGRGIDVYDALAGMHPQPVLGVTFVAGTFDILANVGGGSYEEVSDVLLSRLHAIDGIASAASFFATNEGAGT